MHLLNHLKIYKLGMYVNYTIIYNYCLQIVNAEL